MAFKQFTDFGTSFRPLCSIRRSGQIGFNQGSVRRFNLRPGYVRVFFDEEQRLIGIQYAGSEYEPGVAKLVVRNDNVFVSLRNMLDFYRIDYSETKTFEPIWNEDDSTMMIIDLNRPLPRIKKQECEEFILPIPGR